MNAEQTQSIKNESKRENTKPKKQKNERFKWWQGLLILLLTLVVCVSAGYYISEKYLWSNVDQNQLEQQLKHSKEDVDKKPNDPKARVALGYAYFLNDDNDEAIKQYKVALDLDKNYFDAYLNLGIIYNDEKRYDDALKMANKATELSPRDYKGYLIKGIAYRKLKLYEKATKTLEQADKLMPGNTDIIYEIGMVAEAQGQMKAAEDIYKEAIGYDPLYKPALEGLDRVAKK